MARRDLTDEERADWETVAKAARRLKKALTKSGSETPATRTAAKRSPVVTPPAALTPSEARRASSLAHAAPLSPLPRRDADRLFKPHARVQSRIDLHGMTQEEAYEALADWLRRCHAAGKRHVAVITGKGSRGEGVLRRAVPRWLELPELRRHVAAIAHAAPEKGGEGVLHVLLKKPS